MDKEIDLEFIFQTCTIENHKTWYFSYSYTINFIFFTSVLAEEKFR